MATPTKRQADSVPDSTRPELGAQHENPDVTGLQPRQCVNNNPIQKRLLAQTENASGDYSKMRKRRDN
jgi:hypothetical protein